MSTDVAATETPAPTTEAPAAETVVESPAETAAADPKPAKETKAAKAKKPSAPRKPRATPAHPTYLEVPFFRPSFLVLLRPSRYLFVRGSDWFRFVCFRRW
jgi:hypothetical protein